MITSIFNAMFGCSHKRTTFPITLRSQISSGAAMSDAASSGAARKATYVVCLDCGREFDYNWKEMQMDSAVRTTKVSAVAVEVQAPVS
jgi:hypothetical protein